MNIQAALRARFRSALVQLAPEAEPYATLVLPTQDAKFGDYQANCAMPLAKLLKAKPRDIADRIVELLPGKEMFGKIEVAGPGFINLTLRDDFLAEQLREVADDDERLGIEMPLLGQTIVIDFSSPNVAKPMHVGHLRSTILGDALQRLTRTLGGRVIGDNHLGDWGTQFGMLIYGWRNLRDEAKAEADPLAELARLYPLVSGMGKEDPAVAEACRTEIAKLHEGDPENHALWQQFLPWCIEDLNRNYARLGVGFDEYLGESHYHDMLPDVVQTLLEAGIAHESDGAIAVLFVEDDQGIRIVGPDEHRAAKEAELAAQQKTEGKKGKKGPKVTLRPSVSIVQKSDGAYTYATSDIACIRYRAEHFRANTCLYVVDERQSLHFRQIFAIAHAMGYKEVDLVHVGFGTILGQDRKPYKTRSGDVIALEDLLDEAVARARAIVDTQSADLPEEDRQRIAEVVGIGAVKYGDLAQNRTSDYVFDWDKLIAMDGNTATYLQYAYARCRGIFRKAGIGVPSGATLTLDEPAERALGVMLLRFPEAVAQTVVDYKPNVLTNYLFDLANTLTTFYSQCPVLKAATPELRDSRLTLCDLTARVLQHGLGLLGIETLERM